MEERDVTTAVETFGTLANETRMAAVRELWGAGAPLRFSDLADRAGIDDTANFSYHLDELRPRLVRKTGDRYALTRAGRSLMTAVATGDLTRRADLAPTRVDRPCPFCGAAVLVEWADETLRVRCPDCPALYRGDRPTAEADPATDDGTVTTLDLSLTLLAGRDPSAVLDDAVDRTFVKMRSCVDRVCPDCGAGLDCDCEVCPDHDETAGVCGRCGLRYGVLATFRCDVCRLRARFTPLVVPLSSVPALAFFHDHGHDLTDDPWATYRLLVPDSESVVRRDPLRYELRWAVDGERFTLTLDENLETVSTDRSDE